MMDVTRIQPVNSALQSSRLEKEHQLQSVFSEILSGVGHAGYMSATPLESEQPIEAEIQDSVSGWFDLEIQGRYRAAEKPLELGKQFGDLAVRAYQSGAYAEPKAFLNSLSESELKTVQNVHWLAEPIDVDSLSDEGAINLLIPPPAQVDMNRDGFTQSGVGMGFRFPDSTTPAKVAEAWEAATAGMSWGERSLYELQMKLPVLFANFHLDDQGAYSHHYEPGDPEFVNPMMADDYSYGTVPRDYLAYLEAYKTQIDPLRYAQDKAFWSDFQSRLNASEG
ncbi:hypothetical protein Pla52o_24130 [Novipirellula galeiformis]|uniref:Uncharacterized protein n=1 Tax=Novipirellula galeiformis TaxID=2528004 RepID=A0A5C6CHV5_9BACT|nr:hypothetical protein [Novipirellula galeiformis]TWU22881.1 hypothetical protein Pla52o_24130 [Novipirellula galeiformis]